jgi:hypothetical protein
MKIWFPALLVNTGADIFTERLASDIAAVYAWKGDATRRSSGWIVRMGTTSFCC